MEKMLERIKDRLVEKDSPIKSQKALAEAIGMSEGGFYLMFKKGTMKLKTRQAIAAALNVDESYFSRSQNYNEPNDNFGGDVLKKIMSDLQEMKLVFEEQLRAKDSQIAGLQRMLESVLGKFEGDILMPLLDSGNPAFDKIYREYVAQVLSQVNTIPVKESVRRQDQKLVAPRSQSVRTRQ